MWKHNIDYFKENFENKYLDYYLETYKLLEKVTDKDIEEWTNILTFFYPNIIGEYFKIYFTNLKSDVKKFLTEIEEKDLVVI